MRPAIGDDALAAATFGEDDDAVVVIVGAGAGGCTLAHELARRGIDVVVLEAGRRFTEADFQSDEYAMADLLTWRDRRIATGNSIIARTFPDAPSTTCKGVGGSTLYWAAAVDRGAGFEFRARATYGAIAGASLIDWPLSLEELAPYYTRAEDKMGVTSTHGMPMPPANNNFKVMALGTSRVGYRQIDTCAMAVNTVPRDGRNARDQIGFCMQGCKSGARWSAASVEIPRAEASGHCEVRTEAMAIRIEHNGDGRVGGVLYADRAGAHHFQKARAVCVAGNAIETPRLLLNSQSSRCPDGLANGSGEVGRNFMRHVMGFVYADMGRPVNMHRGLTVAGTVRDETRHDPERGFAGGFHFNVCSVGLPALGTALNSGAWGRSYAIWLAAYRDLSSVAFVGEDLPLAANRVTLHPSEKDDHGLPIPCLHLDDHPNDVAMQNHAYRKATELYDAAGARRPIAGPNLAAIHNLDTCLMSTEPDKGVVNAFGQSHEIANLFVSDGSQFPTALSATPTLTIVALAIRQADYIAERLRGNEL